LRVYWNGIPIDYVLKNDGEIWCASEPGNVGSVATLHLETVDETPKTAFFVYAETQENGLQKRLDLLDEKLQLMERVFTQNTQMTFPPSKQLDQEIEKCRNLTIELRTLLPDIKSKQILQNKEVEQNVAVSLASLSRKEENFLVKEARDFCTKPNKIKMQCRKCRSILSSDCSTDVEFIKTSTEIELCTCIGKNLDSISQKNDCVICCQSCGETLGKWKNYRSYFECSKVMFQNKLGEIVGSQKFESMAANLRSIHIVEDTRNSIKSSSKASINSLLQDAPDVMSVPNIDWIQREPASGIKQVPQRPNLVILF